MQQKPQKPDYDQSLKRLLLRAHERGELTELLVALAGLRLSSVATLTALRRHPMVEELLKESSVTEVIRTLVARDWARAAMEEHFGPLDEDVIEALRDADEATCRDIVLHIATDTLDDVRARLGLAK